MMNIKGHLMNNSSCAAGNKHAYQSKNNCVNRRINSLHTIYYLYYTSLNARLAK